MYFWVPNWVLTDSVKEDVSTKLISLCLFAVIHPVLSQLTVAYMQRSDWLSPSSEQRLSQSLLINLETSVTSIGINKYFLCKQKLL